MRLLKFVFSLTLTIITIVALNSNIRSTPPLGKLLDPLQGFWQNAEGEPISAPKKLKLQGLNDVVTIEFDENLIPHIIAQNDYDLYFAQGYITAFHRLWQMEFQTHAAAGRISEIVGAKALAFDRCQRRKGNTYAARKVLKNMENDSLLNTILQAYTKGVNAYIASLTYKNLPIEYKLLDYHPAPWTPFKSALLQVYMTDWLSGSDADLENTHALQRLGRKKFDFLYPDQLPDVAPVIPRNTSWNFKPIPLNPPPIAIPQQIIPHKFDQSDPANGSNNWAVSGRKASSKGTYLANDPHLALSLPSTWYLTHLQSPTVNVVGATIPGSPAILIGFNDAIAWGVTNARRDARDWYLIDFKDENREEYYYDNLLLKSQRVIEEIKIKGGKTFYDTVLYTHFGPIVYDKSFPDNSNQRKNLALKWSGHMPGKELLTFYLFNRAKDYKDFEAALTFYDSPPQNFAFASAQHDVAMVIGGKFPAKWKEQGKFIMEGNTSAYEWQDFIPKEHNPKIVNPPSGYVSSANEHPTDKSYPYYCYDHSYEHYRNRRINQVLDTLKVIDTKAMMQLQNDNYNLAAAESLPLFLHYIDTAQLNPEEETAYRMLRTWNFQNDPDQIAPSIFKVWQDKLSQKLWKSLDHDSLALRYPDFYTTVYILKHHATSPYLELGDYTSIDALVSDAFRESVHELEEWTKVHQKPYLWGDFRKITINHLARIAPFGLAHVKIGGGKNIVNANEENNGVCIRLLVELGKDTKGWAIYPGGQPGNPGNPYYVSFVEAWSQGAYLPISIQKNATKEKSFFTLTLNPSP
ncbi:MAG: penicillin acylase family protein [Cytophagales bacterium]|nr:penicillin acylase family protein [Cytophagales bacterium]